VLLPGWPGGADRVIFPVLYPVTDAARGVAVSYG
jgi:hypothetical protein